MTPNRYAKLSRTGNRLSDRELLQGWHWCYDFGGLLVGPGMPELNCCKCLPKDHPAYESAESLVLIISEIV